MFNIQKFRSTSIFVRIYLQTIKKGIFPYLGSSWRRVKKPKIVLRHLQIQVHNINGS